MTTETNGDLLTCLLCGEDGVGIGFAHTCATVLLPPHHERLERVLSDCYAQLDAVFDEPLNASSRRGTARAQARTTWASDLKAPRQGVTMTTKMHGLIAQARWHGRYYAYPVHALSRISPW